MEKRKRKIFVTSPDVWDCFIENEVKAWPIHKRWVNADFLFDEEIIVYLSKKSAFSGIIRVQGEELIPNRQLLDKQFFHYQIPINFYITLKQCLPVRPLLKDLELTQGRQNWGGMFQRAIVNISHKDFQYLRHLILMQGDIPIEL